MNIIKGQRFYNTTYNEYNRIVLYSVLYTYNGTIEASLMPFQTRSVLSATTGTREVPFLVGDKLHQTIIMPYLSDSFRCRARVNESRQVPVLYMRLKLVNLSHKF